ncbi:loganic acid O-methyltransferase-like [Aristolochia californica]|uniref:loganic acid O-methyltransferase-like n=1 Tax=Aristolochia californica TaxID=171875 RepID=UPI0035DC9E62
MESGRKNGYHMQGSEEVSTEAYPGNGDGRVKPVESYPMNGGDGPTSYSHNSHYQGEGVNVSKQLISQAIENNITLKFLSSMETYHIADLGCSVGPNTFSVVQNIIGAVEHKLLSLGSSSKVLDFQVSFNDHVSNDFNTLFASLQSKGRRYFAAGVPGSFHGRLFPKASLHFVHSSYAVHWLSQVPDEVKDDTSPAWNKGKIFSIKAKQEVEEAYSAQFAKDMEVILQARAEEVAVDGLMAFTLPYTKGPVYVEQALFYRLFHILELALNDMADKGRLDEVKVNSFNLPIYIPYAQEIQKLVERNGTFTIENMQPLASATKGFSSRLDARQCSMIVRAPMEGIMGQYFGSEVIDEIFEKYVEIAEENSDFIAQSAALTEDLFVLLKRKA